MRESGSAGGLQVVCGRLRLLIPRERSRTVPRPRRKDAGPSPAAMPCSTIVSNSQATTGTASTSSFSSHSLDPRRRPSCPPGVAIRARPPPPRVPIRPTERAAAASLPALWHACLASAPESPSAEHLDAFSQSAPWERLSRRALKRFPPQDPAMFLTEHLERVFLAQHPGTIYGDDSTVW